MSLIEKEMETTQEELEKKIKEITGQKIKWVYETNMGHKYQG